MLEHLNKETMTFVFREIENYCNENLLDLKAAGMYIENDKGIVTISHYVNLEGENRKSIDVSKKVYNTSYTKYINLYFDGLLDSDDTVIFMMTEANNLIDIFNSQFV